MTVSADIRLTQYASGGGCACKIPPGELEQIVAQMLAAPVPPGQPAVQRIDADLLIGVEHGDDAAVVRISDGRAVVATADFFGPAVDDAYTFGRIAGTNALSDVYAVGGTPLVALNLLGWPRAKRPAELAGEVLRRGLDAARHAGCRREPAQPGLGHPAHRRRRAQRGGSAAPRGRADLGRAAGRRGDPGRPRDRGADPGRGDHPDPPLAREAT